MYLEGFLVVGATLNHLLKGYTWPTHVTLMFQANSPNANTSITIGFVLCVCLISLKLWIGSR